MPPAAVSSDGHGAMGWYPVCCAFDNGVIEVQAVEGNKAKSFATRILMTPWNESDQDGSSKMDASVGRTPQPDRNRTDEGPSISRYDYFCSPPSPPGERSLADSFDSTDEILQNSNEARLIQRIVEKRANDFSSSVQAAGKDDPSFSEVEGVYPHPQGVHYYVHRQDSMSDSNSVDSTDVYVVDDPPEIEYLGVLDQHLLETNPAATDASLLNEEIDGSHPRKHQADLGDIFDHLCAATCGDFMLTEPPVEMALPDLVSKPRSVLRKPKWTKVQNDFCEVAPEVDWACNYRSPVVRSENRRVRFQNVEIREFKMTLGNHPSATSGPPVMLDWELFSPRKVLSLDGYERTRPPRRKRRHLKLSLHQRHTILVKERGFSFEEVKSAWQEALEIRKQRKETLKRGLALLKWDEVWESTCRKLNRLVDGTV